MAFYVDDHRKVTVADYMSIYYSKISDTEAVMQDRFPRLRRLRRTAGLRDLVAEIHIPLKCLIYPIFVEELVEESSEIPSMPGVSRIPEADLADVIQRVEASGLTAVLLFGVSHHKDPIGSDTLNENGLLARMIRIAKEAAPSITVIADVCFCEYTDHGHCGVVHGGEVDNDLTLLNLGRQAVVAAKAGADIVAPSAMMDGQVAAIRAALDEANLVSIPIMSYSTKFSSSLYGPFRTAGGTSLKGDRDTYLMDLRNRREALLESLNDEKQGADILMVKPGLHYLDILREIRDNTLLPLAVYHTSGEYSMVKFAAMNGAIDEQKVVEETFAAFRRAGADLIITYFALDYALARQRGGLV